MSPTTPKIFKKRTEYVPPLPYLRGDRSRTSLRCRRWRHKIIMAPAESAHLKASEWKLISRVPVKASESRQCQSKLLKFCHSASQSLCKAQTWFRQNLAAGLARRVEKSGNRTQGCDREIRPRRMFGPWRISFMPAVACSLGTVYRLLLETFSFFFFS
jgi:hypothetical protein